MKMVCRLTRHLIQDKLTGVAPGKVAGWAHLAGIEEEGTFNLRSAFHPVVRGTTKYILQWSRCYDSAFIFIFKILKGGT
jgi:hypothetical protein